MLPELLTTLTQELSLDPAKKNEKTGEYTLFIGGHVVVFSSLNPGCSLASKIRELPHKSKEDLFIYIMKGNFLGQGTGGGTLGLDEDEKSLTLSLSLPYEINYAIFKEKLEEFINHLEYWRNAIEDYARK